jgi:RND superfamily putative drug exporter
LVPAFMALAGEANWWAPRWMRRVYDRFGIHESADLDRVDDEAAQLLDQERASISG